MTGTREFHDTIPVQRKPMDFTPIWYQRRATVAACRSNACASGHKECLTPDACRIPADDEDSEFGAFDGLVRGRRYIGLAWLVIAAVAALAWWLA